MIPSFDTMNFCVHCVLSLPSARTLHVERLCPGQSLKHGLKTLIHQDHQQTLVMQHQNFIVCIQTVLVIVMMGVDVQNAMFSQS